MFNHLFTEFERAVNAMASELLPEGFDSSDSAPETFEALQAHYDATGRILVWNGASDKTIFATPESNLAFRAWHDFTHLKHHTNFTLAGEAQTCDAQIDAMIETLGRWTWILAPILQAEIVGQALYEAKHGKFPVNQKAFCVAYLQDKETALKGVYDE